MKQYERIHENNPYPSLYDSKSAVNEFYKLKHQLCLTEEERANYIKILLQNNILRKYYYEQNNNKR